MSEKHQKIRIKLKSYDYVLLDKSASLVSSVASETGAVLNGPIPIPTHTQYYCVLRSPHIDKKSREHFEVSEHKRIIDVKCSPGTVNALMALSLPPGVSVEVQYISKLN